MKLPSFLIDADLIIAFVIIFVGSSLIYHVYSLIVNINDCPTELLP